MRLLANESVPRLVVVALRGDGHEVAWIADDDPGAGDASVLARARRETRLVLTQDKDFGELAYRARLRVSGVILMRTGPLRPREQANVVRAAIGSREDWAGHLGIIEPGRVRMIALPPR